MIIILYVISIIDNMNQNNCNNNIINNLNDHLELDFNDHNLDIVNDNNDNLLNKCRYICKLNYNEYTKGFNLMLNQGYYADPYGNADPIKYKIYQEKLSPSYNYIYINESDNNDQSDDEDNDDSDNDDIADDVDADNDKFQKCKAEILIMKQRSKNNTRGFSCIDVHEGIVYFHLMEHKYFDTTIKMNNHKHYVYIPILFTSNTNYIDQFGGLVIDLLANKIYIIDPMGPTTYFNDSYVSIKKTKNNLWKILRCSDLNIDVEKIIENIIIKYINDFNRSYHKKFEFETRTKWNDTCHFFCPIKEQMSKLFPLDINIDPNSADIQKQLYKISAQSITSVILIFLILETIFNEFDSPLNLTEIYEVTGTRNHEQTTIEINNYIMKFYWSIVN